MKERHTIEAGPSTTAPYDAVLARARLQLEERIANAPDDTEAWFNLGILSRDRGEYRVAEEYFVRVLELQPSNPLAPIELGLLCRRRGDLDAAADWYRRAIEANPSSVNAHFNLGNWARDTDRFAEAEAEYDIVLHLQPDHYGALINSGYVYEQQVRYAEALRLYKKALSLHPHQSGTYVNIGNLLKEMNDLQGAIAAYQASLRLDPESPEAHHSLALALLATGDDEPGWKEYEWRLRCSDTGGRIGVRVFPRPLWDGNRLDGKTIYIYGEQGLGDNIQFVRFLPEVKRRGGRVIYGCYEHLLRLFEHFGAVDDLVDVNSGKLPPFDTYAALMSLPSILGLRAEDRGCDEAYLEPDAERLPRWRWLRESRTLNVGLVWASSTNNRHARLKSIPFQDLAPILMLPDVTFYSLQITEPGQAPQAANIITLEPDICTLEETAAIMANLDLVLTIDTSIAHLAGAMGKEVWTFLPFSPDWRWPRSGETTTWYPSMRLLRQVRMGNWQEPIAEAAKRLEERTSKKLHG